MRSLVRVQARPPLSAFFGAFLHICKELLFPKRCIQCGTLDTFLCTACLAPTEFYNGMLPIWHHNGELQSTLTTLQAVSAHSSVLGNISRHLKYGGIRELGPLAAQLIWFHCTIPTTIDLVTAVPLHRKRRLQRGYNQAALIAQELALLMSLPCKQLLQRQRHTLSQVTTTDKSLRTANIAGAFSLHPTVDHTDIVGKQILLVDDVCTTGTTLLECARPLHDAGAKTVHAMTLTHG